MPCTVAVGGFFGDEGKGKVIAYLSIKDSAAIACLLYTSEAADD